jgi:glycosyltransferase involved in cell wall biosynthesis
LTPIRHPLHWRLSIVERTQHRGGSFTVIYCTHCRRFAAVDGTHCPWCGRPSDTSLETLLNSPGVADLPGEALLSVVIPVYNEQEFVLELIRRVQDVPVPKELVIVNDASTDGTRAKLDAVTDENVRVFHHEVNKGKGAALHTGFREARGKIVLIQDADLEYDPNEYPRLIQPILDGRAEVVYGSRFIGETHRVLYYWHSVANKGLTMVSNWFTNLNLTDMEICYKVFRRDVIQSIPLREERFGFEPEVTAKLARKGCRIYETPVSYSGRSYTEGKKIGLKDAFRAVYCIVRYALGD